MTVPLSDLVVGQVVGEVTVDAELSFRLGVDWWVTTINPWSFTSGGGVQPVPRLQGRVVGALEQNSTAFRFRFTDGSILSVDLSEAAWVGPEAILFHGPDGQIVVVN